MRFEVSSRTAGSVQVDASNWLSALGEGLTALGLLADLDRLACEVLPNGRVLARDVRSGHGFICGPAPEPEPTCDPASPDADRDRAFVSEPVTDADIPPEAAPPPVSTDTPRVRDDGVALRVADEVTAPHLSVAVEEEAESSAPFIPDAALTVLDERVARIEESAGALFAWHEALDAARALCPADSGAAIEREPDGQLRFLYAFGPTAATLQGAVMPGDAGIAGFAVHRQAAMLVHDTAADPRFLAEFDDVTGYATQAVLCVPVLHEQTVYGVLELLNPPRGRRFARIHLELVEMVADALGARLARALR